MIIKEVEPVVVHTTEVRENDSAIWWIGGIVAIAAIVAIVFFVTRQPGATSTDLINATEQGRLTGQLEASQSVGSSAQSAAESAADRAQASADRAAATAARSPQPSAGPTIINIPAPAAPEASPPQ